MALEAAMELEERGAAATAPPLLRRWRVPAPAGFVPDAAERDGVPACWPVGVWCWSPDATRVGVDDGVGVGVLAGDGGDAGVGGRGRCSRSLTSLSSVTSAEKASRNAS